MKKKILASILTIVFILSFSAFSVSALESGNAGIVSTSSSSLNVRSSASTSSSIITTLKKGSYITLVSKSGSWWKVEYSKGVYGYCSADYIKQISSTAKTVRLSSGVLNVRNGNSTLYSIIATLENGSNVLVLSENGGWSKILFNGTKTGYVYSAYLSVKDEIYTSHSPVKLSVPAYLQTDSRWASVYIGSSGKTIKSIGCTTTCLAMTESYRTGTTIYPNAMSKKLSYSSSGSLYWPSNYITSTSSNSYLSVIYNLLKQGKPVILGAKNASGGQHWVVVKGFTGGYLVTTNFLINDPATSSRTSLDQFLAIYPRFHKIAYYS
ncbi:MAG: SH3 domain-containing protein [Clostridiales bacterium]|nr:SH3 domain-containing protein [Clostridiales bacterium]